MKISRCVTVTGTLRMEQKIQRKPCRANSEICPTRDAARGADCFVQDAAAGAASSLACKKIKPQVNKTR